MELGEDGRPRELHSFSPEYIGPFFGDDEKITGFRGLQAEVWLTPIYGEAFLRVNFERSANPELVHIVLKQMYGFSGPRLLETEEAFLTHLEKEHPLRILEAPFPGRKVWESETA